jgi:hypothetical protein
MYVCVHLYIYELYRYYILKCKLNSLYLSIVIKYIYVIAQFDPY